MRTDIYELSGNEIPRNLREIKKAPKLLNIIGTLPHSETIFLTIIGSRSHTSYGASVVESLLSDLRGYNITIVSGLAIGIDALAHEHALRNQLPTIAIPGSGLTSEVLYPAQNQQLARRIVEEGGALISEFDNRQRAARWTFPVRNRLMAGIADAVLVIEATQKSGSLITAGLAADMGRTVMAIPGSIFNTQSEGTNNLIRDGAVPITSTADMLYELGLTILESTDKYEHCSPEERDILKLLNQPLQRGELLRHTNMPTHEANMLLSEMEVAGLIRESFGYIQKI